jgi:hypothetical protein
MTWMKLAIIAVIIFIIVIIVNKDLRVAVWRWLWKQA